MPSSNLALNNRYAALMLIDRSNCSSILSESSIRNVSWWIYDSPDTSLIILVGNEHTESVILPLEKLNQQLSGSSMICGILRQSISLPTEKASYFFHIPISQFSSEKIESLLNRPNLFCLLTPHSFEICILTDSISGLSISSDFPEIQKPLTGLLLTSKRKSPTRLRHSTLTYDPIHAQIAEVLKRSLPACSRQVRETANLWKTILRQDPPSVFHIIQTDVIPKFGEMFSDVVKPTGQDYNISEDIAMRVDIVASVIKMISEQCQEIQDQIRVISPYQDEWKNPIDFGTHVVSMVFHAINSYVLEIVRCAGISDRTDLVTLFGNNFSVQTDTFHLFNVGKPFSISPTPEIKPLTILTYPKDLVFRLGAFPILAHEVAHMLLDQHRELFEDINVTENDTLKRVLEYIPGWKQLNTTSSHKDEDYVNILNIVYPWIQEILADLVATTLAGPAYVYALSRFTIGSLHQFKETSRINKSHPPMPLRIQLCLEYLNWCGFAIPFQSRYLNPLLDHFHEKLAADVFNTVLEPYTPQKHTAVNEVKESLIGGQIVSASPIAILNVLWDSVARKGEYINELATLISLIPPNIRSYSGR